MKKAPNKENKIIADLHVHLPKPKNEKQLVTILNELTSGIVGITKVTSDPRVLTYDELINFKHPDYEIQQIEKGILAKITQNDKTGYVINTQEVCENTAQPHILAIACRYFIDDNLDPFKVIEEIKKQDGSSIITHPYIISSGDLFRYRLIKKEEEKQIQDLSFLVNEIEVHNGQCIDLVYNINISFLKRLNMKKSNELAKNLVKFCNKKGTSFSDTHFELPQVKTSCIYLPLEKENYILESLKHNIKIGNFENYTQLVSRISFLKGMFLY